MFALSDALSQLESSSSYPYRSSSAPSPSQQPGASSHAAKFRSNETHNPFSLLQLQSPPKGSLSAYSSSPYALSSSSAASDAAPPTLFLLDDILSTMSNTRANATALRKSRANQPGAAAAAAAAAATTTALSSSSSAAAKPSRMASSLAALPPSDDDDLSYEVGKASSTAARSSSISSSRPFQILPGGRVRKVSVLPPPSRSSSSLDDQSAPSVPVSASNPGSLLAAARRSTESEQKLALLRAHNKKEQDEEDAKRARRVTRMIDQSAKRLAMPDYYDEEDEVGGGDKGSEDDDDDDDDAEYMKRDKFAQKAVEVATQQQRASNAGGGRAAGAAAAAGSKPPLASSSSSPSLGHGGQAPSAAALPPHSTLRAPLLHKAFVSEVSQWELLGGPGLPQKARDAFAADLTFRYLCGPDGLDILPKSAVVTRIRRTVIAVIENVVAGGGGSVADLVSSPTANGSGSVSGATNVKGPRRPRPKADLWDEGAPTGKSSDWERQADKEIELGERDYAAQGADEQIPTVKGVRHLLDQDEALQKEIEARQLREKEKEYRSRPNDFRGDPPEGWNKQPQKVPKGPWSCSLCGKGNERDDDKCKVCGRARNFLTKEDVAKRERDKAAKGAENPEDAKQKWKDENDKFKAINDDYLKFIKMKTKTDADAQARNDLAGDISKILESLRAPGGSGGLGPLADQVSAPKAVKPDQWRLHNKTHRSDGREIEDVLQEPWKGSAEAVDLRIKREAFMNEIGAGGDFASKAVKEADQIKEQAQAQAQARKKFAYL